MIDFKDGSLLSTAGKKLLSAQWKLFAAMCFGPNREVITQLNAAKFFKEDVIFDIAENERMTSEDDSALRLRQVLPTS